MGPAIMNPTLGDLFVLRYKSQTLSIIIVMVAAVAGDEHLLVVVHHDGSITNERYASRHLSTWFMDEYWKGVRYR